MSDTQNYKSITLSPAQIVMLRQIVQAQIVVANMARGTCDSVDKADYYREQEIELLNIHAVLVLP